jgi:hypothetical protein
MRWPSGVLLLEEVSKSFQHPPERGVDTGIVQHLFNDYDHHGVIVGPVSRSWFGAFHVAA